MKRLILLTLSLTLSLCLLSAAQAADFKIGVVDLHKVVQQSSEVKKINTDLEKRFKNRQTTIMSKQTQIKTDIERFEKNKTVMSVKNRHALQDKIVRARRDLQRLGQDYQQDLSTEQNRAMKTFLTKVKTAIASEAAFAKAR